MRRSQESGVRGQYAVVRSLEIVKDAEYLERAIKLASRGLGHTRPNPAVGAVIVKGGKIIGEG